MLTLYKNHRNSVGTWKIWNVGPTIFVAHASTIGGAEVIHKEYIDSGKQSRSLDEQVQHRIRSRINKQRDRGYVDSYDEALAAPTNALNLLQPMLAQPLKRIGKLPSSVHIQLKYDGHRCLITNSGGELLAYSRQGKYIDTIDHILCDIDVPEGVTLDGELYAHGVPLQTISSWVKRYQPDTLKLRYHVYDIIESEPYSIRLDMLRSFEFKNATQLVPTYEQRSDELDLPFLVKNAKQSNYEGIILRTDSAGYEAGRRSSSLIKVKEFSDSEYEIIDVIASKEGWGVLVLQTQEGKVFKASAPGTVEAKRLVLQTKDKVIGRMATIEYSLLTNDGIPFQPVCIRLLDDVSI